MNDERNEELEQPMSPKSLRYGQIPSYVDRAITIGANEQAYGQIPSYVDRTIGIGTSEQVYSQIPSYVDRAIGIGATEQVRWEIDSENLGGYIFMCNGRTKPECYMYRVFGLPAGRRENIEKIRQGMKLFLFDYDVKYLYGVYEATTDGRLNWEAAAFGGRFPAQVRFYIYKECLPLPESSFKQVIRDNYQIGSNKFNPVLSGQQVSHLLSLFKPLTKPSSAIHEQHPVVDRYQSHSRFILLSEPSYRYPVKAHYQTHERLPPQSYPYVNLIHSSHAPQSSLPPRYISMYNRNTLPALQPQYTQMNVLQPEHTGYGYATNFGNSSPAVPLQDTSAQYQTSYSVEPVQPYLPEVPKSYERYESAAQAMAPSAQYVEWRYYNPTTSQTQMQENAAQNQSLYQMPESHYVAQPIEQHALTFQESLSNA